jgi:hypothetical protein
MKIKKNYSNFDHLLITCYLTLSNKNQLLYKN